MENKKARDIGLCRPQPDNHVAWSRFVPGPYYYHYTTKLRKSQLYVGVTYPHFFWGLEYG